MPVMSAKITIERRRFVLILKKSRTNKPGEKGALAVTTCGGIRHGAAANVTRCNAGITPGDADGG
jgi:hypothetical protein